MDNLSEAYLSVYQELDEAQMGPVEMEKPDPAGSYEARRKALKDKAEKIRTKKSSQQEQVDLYDLILSHLLDEGYASTPEAAEAMMVNMSEEWRDSIVVEETKRTEYLQNKFNKENQRKSGSALTAIPEKQNTGQALQKARQSERHMRGEK